MAIVVLVLVWAALIAMWVRSRAQDGRFSDPVGTFNRHLRILEHTTPSRFPAAHQRRPSPSGTIAPYRPGVSAGLGPMTSARQVQPMTAASLRRSQSQKRRRDVFFALLAGVLGSLVLGLIPGLHVMLYLQVFFDVMMVAYVALLVRMRTLAAEREAKLAYLAPARQARMNAAERRAIPAVHGTEAPAYGYEFDYGDLAVRRAAN